MSDAESTATTLSDGAIGASHETAHGRRARGRGRGRARGSAKSRGRGRSRGSVEDFSTQVRAQLAALEPMPIMSSNNDDAGDTTATEESEETIRIQTAEKQWNAKASKKKKPTMIAEKNELQILKPLTQCDVTNVKPTTSSLGGFLSWLFDHVIFDKEIKRLTAEDDCTFTIGEFCAGMATGSICTKLISDIIFQKSGRRITFDTVLITEMCKWKMKICERVCTSCGDEPKYVARTQEEADEAHPTPVDFAIAAIECDDISSMSTTPKSVLDAGGRSGASFLEFVNYLQKVVPKPKVIMLECVSNLMKHRQSVGEKGTLVVAEKLAALGYIGSWRILNSVFFYVPQSRTRVYGCFLHLPSYDEPAKSQGHDLVELIWKFVSRCQLSTPESLEALLLRSGLLDGDHQASKKCKVHCSDTSSHEPKWKKEHEEFRNNHRMESNGKLSDVACQILSDVESSSLPLAPREAELSALLATKTMQESPGCQIMVGDIGNSIRFCKFRAQIHPCFLPSEKYLYVINGKAFLNTHSAHVPFALQSFGKKEVEKMGLEAVTLKQARDLCGNSFTGNVAASLILAILIEYLRR